MAITAFTGPPGSGKSHALVKDVILPAVMAGRRVLTNIDGINPDAIEGYCLQRVDDASRLGKVIPFHGEDAQKAGFWPDETTAPGTTTVQGGDLVVFDEWALFFQRRGKEPNGCNVEAFLRWHRHLTGPGGEATDVAIGTQVPADVNNAYRALIVRSYKFKKLSALGADGRYAWSLFDGHLQPKGGQYRNGTGKYDPEVFPLYASSSAAVDGTHVELKTNRKDSVWSGWRPWAVVIAPFVLLGGGALGLNHVMSSNAGLGGEETSVAVAGASPAASGAPLAPGSPAPAAAVSGWRIVGQIDGEQGARVIVADESGGVRMMKPDAFEFDEGRPVSGMIDGKKAYADDRLPQSASGSLFGGPLL